MIDKMKIPMADRSHSEEMKIITCCTLEGVSQESLGVFVFIQNYWRIEWLQIVRIGVC